MKRTLKKHKANNTKAPLKNTHQPPTANYPRKLVDSWDEVSETTRYLDKLFGAMSPARHGFVGLVAQLCRQQSEGGYHGGVWDFYEVPGSVYIVLNGARPKVITSPNGYSFEATPEVAGLCWSIAALALMTNQFQCLRSYSAWKALKQYAETLPEYEHIHWFLD